MCVLLFGVHVSKPPVDSKLSGFAPARILGQAPAAARCTLGADQNGILTIFLFAFVFRGVWRVFFLGWRVIFFRSKKMEHTKNIFLKKGHSFKNNNNECCVFYLRPRALGPLGPLSCGGAYPM